MERERKGWRRWLLPVLLCIGAVGCGGSGGGGGGGNTPPPDPVAPVIATQPQDSSVVSGAPASFSVTATGSAPLTYQWRRNGTAIGGASAAVYTLTAARSDDGAEFSVVVGNSAGSVTSRAARLTVTDPAVTITTGPQSVTAAAGQTATFSVSAEGSGTLGYQWLRNGADIAGATAARYTTAALTLADDGARFSVRVSDGSGGSATSGEALLTVTAAPTAALQLYRGDAYTLALRQDGRVLMLGSDAALDRAPSTPVPGTSARLVDGLTAVDISGSLAVAADGRLWRWGARGGDSTTAPRVVAGIDQVTSALSAGSYTLMLRRDGTVWHFPGVESVSAGGATSDTARSIAGLGGVSRLVLGLTGTAQPLAIKGDGTVWQLSWSAQVTMGPSGPVTTHTGSAQQVAGLADVADIACASSSHCLARRRDGSLIAWGLNDEGQLGSNGGSGVALASAVAVPGIGRVTAIGAMNRTSVAITQDGRLWTWGMLHGQGDASSFYLPTPLAALDGAVALSCSGSCSVLLGDGSLWTWGGSDSSMSILSRTPQQEAGLSVSTSGVSVTTPPQPVQTHVGQTATFSVVASSRSGAAPSYQWLRDGVELAGARSAGYTTPALTLADDGARYSVRVGDATGSIVTRSVELGVTASATSVAAPGRVMTDRLYSYSDAAGSAARWSWGDGSAASNGSPVTKVWRAPGDYSAQRNGSPLPVVAIGQALTDGDDHSCALRALGTVVCWGRNSYGQVGDGSVIDRRLPTPVPGLTGVVSITAASEASCALKSDRSVWCWGRNDQGQLGNGTLIDSGVPTQVVGLTDATAIAAGSFHVCALRLGGGVRCWGSNSSGALGTATPSSPSSTPVDVAGLSDAVSLASGSGSCAVRRNGQVVCWGTRGLVPTPSGTPVYQATTVAGLENIVSLRFGTAHVCALRGDQRVLCWGDNLNGKLGDGSSTARSSPTLVTGLTDAVAISAGDNHSCALRAGGSVACWGAAGYGALGAFPPAQSVPVSVLTPRDIPDLGEVTALQSQGRHSCALTRHGQVLCWGEGFLGAGSQARNYTPVPIFGGSVYWK